MEMRELVELGVANRNAGCAEPGGVGGVGGASSECSAGFPDWASGEPSDWHPANIESALSWLDDGCPAAEQYTVLSVLIRPDEQWLGEQLAEKLLSEVEGECTYQMTEICGAGRPFLVDGAARRPFLVLPEGERLADLPSLACEWLSDAQMEHASVAAFARLTLQLMSTGAPVELVRASQEASLDEARHAQLCLEEAARHGAAGAKLGAIELDGVSEGMSTEQLLVSNIIEGCIGETLAAARAREQAAGARPDLAESLLALADDEEQHAALAWKILAWQLENTDPRLARVAAQTFRQRRPSSEKLPTEAEVVSTLRAEGRLSAPERCQLDAETWRAVVLPLAAVILGKRQMEAQRDAQPFARIESSTVGS